MPFEDYLAIEEFRIRYHPDTYLRLLCRKEGTKEYLLIANLEAGYFIGRREATDESKLQEILTINYLYSPSLDPKDVSARMIAVDLVYPDNTYKRYSIGSNHPPSFSANLYSATVNANFNDRNPISGVFVPAPDDPAYSFISRETPSGDIDGSNRTFFSEFDFSIATLEVYLNGLLQEYGTEFTISGTRTIIFVTAPLVGDEVLISYFIGFGDQIVSGEIPTGTLNGSNVTFTTEFDFVPESVAVYVNGVMQKKVQDFNTSGLRTISLMDSPGSDEEVLVSYLRS